MNDRDFLSEFEAAVIPPDRWKHRDHVRVAYLYVRDLRFADAVGRLRSGIRALNRANGMMDTPTSGYHETLTVAWARVVADAIARHGPTRDFESFADANPSLFRKEILLAYYTKERLLTPEARASFVEPDVAPLPGPDASGSILPDSC